MKKMFFPMMLTAFVIVSAGCAGTEKEKPPSLPFAVEEQEWDSTPGWFQLEKAKMAVCKKKYEEAIELFNKGEEIISREAGKKGPNPKADWVLAQILLARSGIYIRTGRHEKAVEDCKKMIRRFPKQINAYYNLGCAYNGMGEYEKAAKAVIMALQIAPDYHDAKQLLKVIQRNLKKSKKEEEKKPAP